MINQIRKKLGPNSEKLLNSPRTSQARRQLSGKKEVLKLERKVKVMMVTTVLILTILSGIAFLAYASRGTSDLNALMTYANGATNDANTIGNVTCNYGGFYGGMRAFAGPDHRWRPGEFLTVSQEFQDNVVNITESDSDVQKLLADGYNITGVRPIVSATVEADGTVTMKATTAIVTLAQNTTGRATVWVNIEQAKVARIVILSMTVIEKP